jgi:zinc transporter ZupT
MLNIKQKSTVGLVLLKRGRKMTGQSGFVWVALFAISAMIVNTIGIWVVYKNRRWAEKNKEYFMCFAAGGADFITVDHCFSSSHSEK